MSREEIEKRLEIDLQNPTILVAYHPVTIARDTLQEVEALFTALGKLSEQVVFSYPNADAGSRALIERTRSFIATQGHGMLFTNLGTVMYLSLLRQVDMLLGNSSSGIMESASFSLPTVNVGLRQQGRERPRNVLEADADADSILHAIGRARTSEFQVVVWHGQSLWRRTRFRDNRAGANNSAAFAIPADEASFKTLDRHLKGALYLCAVE